jgi:hypothetical protein
MEEIPVTFTFEGKEYKGYFSKVAGGGSNAMFFLHVDGFYFGKLWHIDGHPGFENGLHAVPEGWAFCF